MTRFQSRDDAAYDHDHSEDTSPQMQRMQRKTQPLRGKYNKKRSPVRLGIKQRRVRRTMW